jgi:GT2 family glycosyltransferase
MIRNLSCGIVIYDEVREIQNLLPKLKQELKDYSVEWIFILNHEQNEIRKWISNWVREQLPEAVCLENPSNNLGFARQLVLEKSNCDYIYLTDPDIDIIPGNLKKLIQLINTDISEDFGQKYVGFGGTVTHKSENFFLQSTFEFMSGLSKILPFSFQIQNHSYLMAVDHLPACHLLLNKRVALKIGGFSAGHSKCGEDLDFTHRAYNHDYRFIFLPSAQVYHWQNLSLAKWYYKMFTLGRVQIPVQKLNMKKGLRYYRLIPALSLLTALILSAVSFNFFLFAIGSIALASLFSLGFLGFFLTYFTYSLGGLFEIIMPFFECKNEEELKALNSNLQSQLFAANKEN